MKMEKHWKRFFTLDRHHAEGFTLVELIVVIAILAILAGVAVPAYSGYIEKANEAADLQLLDAMTTAFHSACIDENVSILGMEGTQVDLIGESGAWAFAGFTYPAGIDFANTLSDTLPSSYDPFTTTFLSYYGNANELVFTSSEKPVIIFTDGAFGKVDGEVITINGITITVSKELAEALQNNTFSDIGANTLLGKVDTVAGIADALVMTQGSVINKLIAGDDNGTTYLNNLAASLNMKPDDPEFLALVYDMSGEDPVLNTSVLANSLVLTAAQKTENMDTSFLGTAGSVDALKKELDDPATATDAMAKLALTYGMYTSYAKHTGQEDKAEAVLNSGSLTGMAEVLRSVESEEFQTYLNSDAGKADLDAYMASMQVVNDSTSQSTDTAKDILTNGFTDPELVEALGGLMNPDAE